MMTARKIEEAERELRELRQEEWADLALAVLTIALSLSATALHPPLAVPLFIGGLAVGVLAARAFIRRWDLFDRLLPDRDAYAIAEVHRRAEDIASMKNRRVLAQSVRNRLNPGTGYSAPKRVAAAAEQLSALVRDLEDEGLTLDPVCAVNCHRLVTNGADSPLIDSSLPLEELYVRIQQIRAGFERRRAA